VSDIKKRQFNAALLPNRKNFKRKPIAMPEAAAAQSVVLGLDDLSAAVIAVRADVVTQMGFTRARLDGKRCALQEIMRAVHAAFGRRFLVLLDCHDNS
jgi:hypothetical protein